MTNVMCVMCDICGCVTDVILNVSTVVIGG